MKRTGYRSVLGCLKVAAMLLVSLAPNHAHSRDDVDFTMIGRSDRYPGKDATVSFGVTVRAPDNVGILRGMWISCESSTDHDFTILSAMWGFALIKYTDPAPNTKDQWDQVIAETASALGHPELVNAPMVVDGGSRFAGVGGKLAEYYPTRLIAYCADNMTGSALVEKGGANIPRLLFVEQDRSGGMPDLKAMISGPRGRLEPVLAVPQWGWGHGFYSGRDMLYVLFDQIIRMRLPADADPSKGPVVLDPVDKSSSWSGDCATWFAEWPVTEPGDKAGWSWLPNEFAASVWKALVTRHPTETQRTSTYGCWHVGSVSGDNGILAAMPSIKVLAPFHPFCQGALGGLNYLPFPLDTTVVLRVQSIGYTGVRKVRFLKGPEVTKEVASNAYGVYSASCAFDAPGVASVSVQAELSDGRVIQSRPSLVFVCGARKAANAVSAAKMPTISAAEATSASRLILGPHLSPTAAPASSWEGAFLPNGSRYRPRNGTAGSVGCLIQVRRGE